MGQEPGRPGSPAPKALESGRTHRPKRRPRDSPETSTSRSYHSNQEETSQHCESKTPQAETWRADSRKKGAFLNLNAFRRVTAVTTGGAENSLKEERHDRYNSADDQAWEEPMPSHTQQENSQARSFQLDTTTARRNLPVKRRRVLRQAPRGRGKRRPAPAH